MFLHMLAVEEYGIHRFFLKEHFVDLPKKYTNKQIL